MSPPMSDVAVYADQEALFEAAAERLSQIASSAVAARGRFFIALSGGNTPRAFYLLLSQSPWRARVPWAKAEVFFGDERCLPPQHPDSNFHIACKAMIEPLSLPQENVHRMLGELDPHAAAAAYQQEIVNAFSNAANMLPRFDLVLLGLGADGHTASLFPGSDALQENEKLVVANYVDKLKAYRLTLTLPVLNNARHIMFLVVGENKSSIANELFVRPNRSIKYPAELIRPTDGTIIWFLDRAAASKLQPSAA